MNCAFRFLALFYCDFKISFYVLSCPGMKSFEQVKVSIRRTAATYTVIESPCISVTLTPEEVTAMAKADDTYKLIQNSTCKVAHYPSFQLTYSI
jgi:hypothetical protein